MQKEILYNFYCKGKCIVNTKQIFFSFFHPTLKDILKIKKHYAKKKVIETGEV